MIYINHMTNKIYRRKLKFSNTIPIEFQVIDWQSYDDYDSDDEEDDEEFDDDSSEEEEKKNNIRKFNIKAYGVTQKGNSVCVHIKDFKPYFFVKLPIKWGTVHFKAFIAKLKMIVGEYHSKFLCKAELVHKKEFYGFTDNALFKFAKLSFHNKSGFYTFQRKLSEKMIKLAKYGINHKFNSLNCFIK